MSKFHWSVQLLWLWCVTTLVKARSWRDVMSNDNELTEIVDTAGFMYLQIQDLAFRKEHAETVPQSAPIVRPASHNIPWTDPPSPTPSRPPTDSPSPRPTTSRPTPFPTELPTPPPTTEWVAPHVTPEAPRPWYFNYNTTSPYGPGQLSTQLRNGFFDLTIQNNHWTDVSLPPNDYWREFTEIGFGPWKDTLSIHMPLRNVCNGPLQSPINVKENGGTCYEHHEVRSLPGDFGVRGNDVEKRIESNKLRLVYKRRPCNNLQKVECQEPDPPHADFPYGFGGFADVVHVDFKVPSEHLIENERFDAEMQIFHIHPGRKRLLAQSVLIRTKSDGYNYYLQEALDAFQREFNQNREQCHRRMQEQPQLLNRRDLINSTNFDFFNWAKTNTFKDDQTPWKNRKFQGGVWDPHHRMLVPTIHFYRYDGSLTEPPCGEFVTWWVADKPMLIDADQLHQLKSLLFHNLDSTTCQPTSVHFEKSVARPVRETNNRAVWKCTLDHFGPDAPP